MHSLRRILLVSLLALALDRTGYSWAPIAPPSTCTPYNWIWWGHKLASKAKDRTGVERSNIDWNFYHDDQDTGRIFVGNYWTLLAQVHVAKRDIELNKDYLEFSVAGSSSTLRITGPSATFTPTWYWVPGSSQPLTSHPRLANFHTNASISGEGFQIDQVSLCSGPGGAWGTVVVPGKRYSGLMLGTGDVIYLGVNGPPTGNVLHLPMWHPVDNLVDGSYSGANPDIDMYVQCGGFPTPTSHLRASVRLDSDEFIRISSADCPSSSMLIIAITSFQGAGQFEFMPSLAKATSTTPTTLRVLYETAAGGETTAQTNELTSMLKQFSHRLYGATDGQVLITHFDVVRKANGYFDYTYPVATTSEKDTCRSACAAATGLECDICISQDIPGAGSIGHFRHSIFSHFNLSNWASVLVHEWGHYALGINGAIGNEYCEQTPGEFTEGDGSTCGHSVMGKFDLTQNFCQPRNHGKGGDADAPDCSPAGGLSNWSAGASVLTGDPPQTADWFNFADFPFGQTSAPTHPSLPTIACHPIVPSIPCN